MSPALRRAHALLHDALMTPRYTTAICVLLILFELVMNLAIIHRVPYTEIDWTAYMQEVQGVISGEFNYMNLKGDTGPLVYPAGFVWIYGLLWKATNGGQGIRTAQLVFACLYMANLCVVLAIYRRIRGFPPVLLILLVVSKRVHSIFVLRLFNDPVAMLFAYICVLCLGSTHYRQRQWKQVWSALALSAGISVKMNVLLFAPGVLYMWWRIGGIRLVAVQATVVAVTQAIVAVPFLATYPTEYVARAFEFGRQFAFQWTVNWRFLGEDLFLSPMWAAMLLVVHLALLTVFAVAVWPRLAAQSFVKV
ncbi:dolichyl-P-Man:Man(5)GlcNAc(2)-PP-dolichol alpha-1,3-mannosyltransferase, partial [Linderina macrospora]